MTPMLWVLFLYIDITNYILVNRGLNLLQLCLYA